MRDTDDDAMRQKNQPPQELKAGKYHTIPDLCACMADLGFWKVEKKKNKDGRTVIVVFYDPDKPWGNADPPRWSWDMPPCATWSWDSGEQRYVYGGALLAWSGGKTTLFSDDGTEIGPVSPWRDWKEAQ